MAAMPKVKNSKRLLAAILFYANYDFLMVDFWNTFFGGILSSSMTI